MRYGSVCSGIEAASVAWRPLGWRAAWFAEIEKFPAAVLAHHYPNVPNLGDMTRIARDVLGGSVSAPDVLVGGTPCQAFSVAGMRAGLEDPRGALTIKFVELADAIDHVRVARGEDPSIVVWENVPGVLSDRGNAFGCFLGALAGEDCELQPPRGKWKDAGCVYGPQRAIAWRVLDAQYFGLAQRRRRVFVVASARSGFDPAELLFEREGVRRDTPPRRGEEKNVAGPVAAGVAFGGNNQSGPIEVATARNACASASGRMDFESETFVVHGTQDPCVSTGPAFALGRNHGGENAVLASVCATMDASYGRLQGCSGQDANHGHSHLIPNQAAVRRLTPVETERLQGFPDNYTRIPWRGKPAQECPDGPRYKAIGNSMAVPCMRFIGLRIKQHLEQIT